MALDGGGGGGGPIGQSNSFTGKAEALEIIGDFAYAYNQSEMSNSALTVFEFTTGNYLFVGEVELTGPTAFDSNIASGGVVGLSIALGGNVIAYVKSDSEHEDMTVPSSYSLIIPPYTDVKMETLNIENNASYVQSIGITGRLYRD